MKAQLILVTGAVLSSVACTATLPQQDAEAVDFRSRQGSGGVLLASYYGDSDGFQGRPTASGERFDRSALTAAHPTLPFGTLLRVTNQKNGKSVVVRVNDRGPFRKDRGLDLSAKAAKDIDLTDHGVAPVKVDVVKKADEGGSGQSGEPKKHASKATARASEPDSEKSGARQERSR